MVDLSAQTIMWTIEAILIGKLSAAAFAGVGMAIQMILVFFAVLLTFVVGATLIVARHLGAGERWEANHTLGQALMVAVVISFIFGIAWYSGAIHLFKIIKEVGSQDAKNAGITYLRTVALFAPFIITNFVAVGVIRGSGDTHYSMTVNTFINGLNVFLAPLLIFGWFGFPRLEVKGAAFALGISHTLGFCLTLFLLRSRKLLLYLSFRELTTPNFSTFKRLFKLGLPTTVEQATWAVGQLIVTSFAASLHVTILATHTVFMRYQSILSMMYMGFGFGAMTLMGKNLGADQSHLAERTAKTANRVMGGSVLFIVAILILFSKQLIHVFTTEPDTVRLGSRVIFLFAFAQIPKAVNWVIGGNLRGAGDLKWLMWMTIIAVLVFEVTANYVAAFIMEWGLYGIWAIHGFDELFRFFLYYNRFKGGKWKLMKV